MAYLPPYLFQRFGPSLETYCVVRGWLYSKGDTLRLKTNHSVIRHPFFFFDYGGVMAFSWIHPRKYDLSLPIGLQEDYCYKYEVID